MEPKQYKPFEQYQDTISRLLQAQSEIEGTPKTDMVKTITFQLTDGCNLRCTYCYQINKGTRVMSFETAKKFIDLLIEDSYKEDTYVSLTTTPGVVIEFIGGEPLLEIDLMDQITDYFRWRLISENHPWANKFLVSMISNGVLYFSEKVQNYLKKNQGSVSFSISLDGCKSLHDMCRLFPDGTGSYDLAEAGCKHYMKHFDSNMLTKMTIAPENITWVFEAFQNLYKLGYKIIHANCVYEKGWTIDHAKILYNQLKQVADYMLENDLEFDVFFRMLDKDECGPHLDQDEDKNYCGSTGCMLACDPDGIICPCIRFMKSSLGDEIGDFALGTIEDGIGIKDEHRKNIETLDSITRTSQSSEECLNCPIQRGCGWCTAYNYQETGDPNKRCTYICWTHRAKSLAICYYWNKIYKKYDTGEVYELYLDKDIALQIIDEEEYNMLLDLTKREND